MFERPTDTLGKLAGSLYSTDGDVFAGARSTFADGNTRIDRMERHEVNSTLAGALPHVSSSFRSTDANSNRTGADLPCSSGFALLLLLRLGRRIPVRARLAPSRQSQH